MNIRQTPQPGTEMILLAGDVLEFRLQVEPAVAGEAFLRTNIGHAPVRRDEIIRHVENGEPVLARDWRDLRMETSGTGEYILRLPVTEIGWFEAKTLFIPAGSKEVAWPEGGNVSIKVEPADTACANTVYSAFVRLFGRDKDRKEISRELAEKAAQLDKEGYTVIAASGTFRDLSKQLDLIINKMRFRIIKLLPIHPAPTTYARMGRFGSPYAVLDFMDVDPMYAEFDRKTTPMEQFEELIDEIHSRNAKIHLDIPINHTGWAAALQIHHPEWYSRAHDSEFESPGAWGVTWEDLSRLEYRNTGLWKYIAEVFLFWCRKGVDGFRCDAGYMVPEEVWQYITAKVRREFPDTVFLLEGLGGALNVTESLLTKADLNWSYSELFQNYSREQLEHYLPQSFSRSARRGLQIDFAETHDNNRLASRSHCYAIMRTALSGMASQNGGLGITCGSEWFAAEKIKVHDVTSLNWGTEPNMTGFLSRLNAVFEAHPAFHHGAECKLVHTGSDSAIAILRMARSTGSSLLCLINLNDEHNSEVVWRTSEYSCGTGQFPVDLLTGQTVKTSESDGKSKVKLAPGQVMCLSGNSAYLELISRISASHRIEPERNIKQILNAKAAQLFHYFRPGSVDFSEQSFDRYADELRKDPAGFCRKLAGLEDSALSPIVTWQWPRDSKRLVMVPPGQMLLLKCKYRFRAVLPEGLAMTRLEESIPDGNGSYFTFILPHNGLTGQIILDLTIYEGKGVVHCKAPLLLLSKESDCQVRFTYGREDIKKNGITALCTNNRGAMALVHGDFGVISSQYNCLLGANLSPDCPVDRHIMLTRIRAWLVFTGYSVPLDISCTRSFSQTAQGSVKWLFDVPVGNGMIIPIEIRLSLVDKSNRVDIQVKRGRSDTATLCPHDTDKVKLIMRTDIEDRNFHTKTKAYAGLEAAFSGCVTPGKTGFRFAPAPDRVMEMTAGKASFTFQPEWYYSIWHPEDAERGLDGHSDLFSPGYFSIDLPEGSEAVISAAVNEPTASAAKKTQRNKETDFSEMPLKSALRTAIDSYIVKRDDSLTVIAGYPWFLDWGRDTLICLRGIIQAGMLDQAREILRQFAMFEKNGTLPNMIRGRDDSNRETSDASLWFIVACRDLARAIPSEKLLQMPCNGRNLKDIVISIGKHYISGTPNGIKMDQDSGLIFSPSHYTWMDTNHPAGSPREGYPVEIQAMWYSALDFLSSIDSGNDWKTLALKVRKSISYYYNRHGSGFLSDCLHCHHGTPAEKASPDDAVRPNQLLAITLGAIDDPGLMRTIIASCEELLVPGAIRSLADRHVKYPMPVSRHGHPLNDPHNPYWGEYNGDEDTRRKPAYHNGTGWTWQFPLYAEALYLTYGKSSSATAMSILNSSLLLVENGCIGQLPELTDGDYPHRQKGCTAQAWGVTELFRVLDIIQTGKR